MRLLDRALDLDTVPAPQRRAMALAALGHDLYEDSRIDPAGVAADYGADVDRLIEAVTERAGVAEFVGRVASGPEEARLVKLCDLIDNYTGLVDNGLVQSDRAKWAQIVRTHMEPMFDRLAGAPFTQHPKAGGWLSGQLDAARKRFWAVAGEAPIGGG